MCDSFVLSGESVYTREFLRSLLVTVHNQQNKFAEGPIKPSTSCAAKVSAQTVSNVARSV